MMQSINSSCQACKKSFEIDERDQSFYIKAAVPAPTFCPTCRLIRRLTHQNQRSLYKRNCSLCSKSIIAMYPAETPFPVYCMSCYESDNWSALDYGVAYDKNVSFFEQLNSLRMKVPRRSLMGLYQTWVNSEYNNMAGGLKDCYLLFNSDFNTGCLYGSEIEQSEDCMDLTMADSCNLCYDSVGIIKCYRTMMSEDCQTCRNVWYSKSLSNCSNCLGCVNLKNAEYHIFNQPHTKEDYEEAFSSYALNTYEGRKKFEEQFNNFKRNFPVRFMHGKQNENVSGDYINNSRNVRDSYIVTESDECRYCMWLIIKNNKSCYDFTQFGENSELVYEALTSGRNISRIICGMYCVGNVSRLEYSDNCYHGASDLFGCVGIKKKQYCILNKEYEKEEYEILRKEIITHMNELPYKDKRGCLYRYGDFFPIEHSVYAYNETDAGEFFPLSKDEVLSRGYRFREMEEKTYTHTKTASDLLNSINEVGEDILKEVILCETWSNSKEKAVTNQCSKVYRVTERELAFYKQAGLPLPHKCPNCRHRDRTAKRNPITLHPRTCDCVGSTENTAGYINTSEHAHGIEPCSNSFHSAYPPENKALIYCEVCYQKEAI